MAGSDLILFGGTTVLAVMALAVTAALKGTNRAAFVFAQLAFINGIYVGFVVGPVESVTDISPKQLHYLLVEQAVGLGFLIAGLLAFVTGRYMWLSLLIVAHAAVDLLHLSVPGSPTPQWYEIQCIYYDIVVGSACAWLLRRKG